MYSIDELLKLVRNDGAEELRVHVGVPPIFVLEGEGHTTEGPAITAETAEELLRSIASSRQMRELRDRGEVQFVYTFRRSSPFLVHARMEDEYVGFDIR
jgi:Tfp pilus assembly ATPase PilU